MDLNYNTIILSAIIAIAANIITYFSVVLLLLAKWKGRRAPTSVISDTIKTAYFYYIRTKRRRFSLSQLEGEYIEYIDWDKGIGWGYMDQPLRLGDQIYVKSNKKRKSMVLIVYKI